MNHMEFVGDTQFIVNTSGDVVVEIPAIRTNNGTFQANFIFFYIFLLIFRIPTGTIPKGSTWTRNPFPMESNLPLIPGLPDVYGRGPFLYNVMDKVKVPADLRN
jgi:hypothetical protein